MSNLNYNHVALGGRLVADPELRTTQSGVSVCTARMAVTRKSFNGDEPETDFFNIVAWRGGAEFLANYFRKGSAIMVNGRLQVRSWENDDGDMQYITEVVTDEIFFVDSKADADSRASADKKPARNTNKGNRAKR